MNERFVVAAALWAALMLKWEAVPATKKLEPQALTAIGALNAIYHSPLTMHH